MVRPFIESYLLGGTRFWRLKKKTSNQLTLSHAALKRKKWFEFYSFFNDSKDF